MKAIVAADRNWGIGYENHLLVSIPGDMRFFRETTMGQIVIMGRKTWESLPGRKGLPGRVNIVMSANGTYTAEGAIVVHGVEELHDTLALYEDKDAFVIGGSGIYRLLLPYVDIAYVTKIDHVFRADCFFPDLESDENFVMAHESEEHTCFDLGYRFTTYKRCK